MDAEGPFVMIARHPNSAEIGGCIVEANLGKLTGLIQPSEVILKINPISGTDSFEAGRTGPFF